MVLTVQHLIDLIAALPKNEPFDYVIPGENKVVLIATSEDSIRMDKLKSDGSRKSCGMSKDILECITDNVQEGVPFSVDSIFNGSGSGRSAWEAILACTTEFYKCKVGKQKHLIWVPTEPHKLGVAQDYNGTIENNDSLSPENVKRQFAFFLERCCKTSHRTDRNPLYLSGNAPVSYISFLEPDKLFDYNPQKWSHIRSMYEITNHHEVEKIFTQLLADPDFMKRDTENNQGWRSGAIGYYVCFLNAFNQFSKVININEGATSRNSEPIELCKSTSPYQFVWDCVKIFNSNNDLNKLFNSKYAEHRDGTVMSYMLINGCYAAAFGKSPSRETIKMCDGDYINAEFEARQVDKFADAVNDVFDGRYKITISNEDSNSVYRLLILKFAEDKYLPYISALKTKPFMLLAGISGTGKSRIVREMAKACWREGDAEYGKNYPSNFEMIQVKPNWHDSSELIGYVSRINGEKYVVGPFLRFMAKAIKNPTIPHFLCLDEMNLAPVEQYFAEYLSVIESRKMDEDGRIYTDPLIDFTETEAYGSLIDQLFEGSERKAYKTEQGGKRLCLPQNLFVVGTVNMDETTYSFSRKVLDRAMTIEMNEVDLNGGLDCKREHEFTYIPGNAIIGTAVEGCDVYSNNQTICNEVIDYLSKVNNKLENTPFKIAYRTRNEFLVYAVNRLQLSPDEDKSALLKAAMDEMTSMKILSRIEGERSKCVKPLEGIRDILKEIIPAEQQTNSVSLNKIENMLRKGDYISYWD